MPRLRTLPIALLLGILGTAPVSAATPIGHGGRIGQYATEDTIAHPGATCTYQGTAGHQVLHDIRVRHIVMWGSRNELQEVGYRLLVQRRTHTGWATVAIGPLRTALVEKDVGNGVPPSMITRDPRRMPSSGRYRAVLRLLWFDNDDGSVEGWVRLRIDLHARTFDGSRRPTCPGQAPTTTGARYLAS